MKPLREEYNPADPNEVAGAALLSRIPPLDESTVRRRRVRMALEPAASKRKSGRFFSPVLVAAVLLIATTGATATVTRLWKRSHFWQPAEPPARAAIAIAPKPPVLPEPKVELVHPPTESTPAPVAARATVPPRAQPKHAAAAPRPAAPTQPLDPASGPGASLMVEAMQARKSGDAARASALLSEYQNKYPQGTFQEEALALSIESAAARGSDSAPRLASEYLRRYPSGRFRDLAQRALKSSAR